MRPCVLALAICLAALGVAEAGPHLGGFVEAAWAIRVQKNAALSPSDRFIDWAFPRSELRTQLRLSGGGERDEYFARLDLVSDGAIPQAGGLDLREAYVKLHPYHWLDVKIGRQVATWGTGDLVFANDLFAKDWEAFFTGMDLAYLKPPQDLLRIAVYTGGPTLEWAFSPYFTLDRLPDGGRLSVFNPFTRAPAGAGQSPAIQDRPRDLSSAEWYARLSGLEGGYEWALYAYRGYYPQPLGVTTSAGSPALFSPRLASGGASLRGSVAGYLIHLEGAYYYSEEDPEGASERLPNSSVRLFAGGERSLGGDWVLSAQWLVEWMQDFDLYFAQARAVLAPPLDEFRHTLTWRLQKPLRYQTVRLGLFGFWGVSDRDLHLRPSVEYDFSDALKLTFGANWLDGRRPHTLFGQFRNNSNLYGRVRYSF